MESIVGYAKDGQPIRVQNVALVPQEYVVPDIAMLLGLGGLLLGAIYIFMVKKK
jgi:hypothetical protein